MNFLKADFLLALRLAYHSRLPSIVFWLLLLLLLSFYISIQFSARQLATVSMDIGLSVIRFALPLLIVLLVQELFSREFERKLYLNSFTYPRSRTTWLLARLLAILFVIITALVCLATVLAILSSYAESIYHQATMISLGTPFLITIGMLALDFVVVTAIAILLAVSARTPSFVLLGTIGFVLIARSYTPIIELLRNNPHVISEIADPRLYQDSLGLLAFILPDLGRLDVRMIALYNDMTFLPSDWPLLIVATLAYVAVLLGLSIWVLNKREFS